MIRKLNNENTTFDKAVKNVNWDEGELLHIFYDFYLVSSNKVLYLNIFSYMEQKNYIIEITNAFCKNLLTDISSIAVVEFVENTLNLYDFSQSHNDLAKLAITGSLFNIYETNGKVKSSKEFIDIVYSINPHEFDI